MNLKFFVFFTLVTFWAQNLVSHSLKNDDCQSALLLTRDTLLTDTLRLSTLSTALNCDYRTPQFTRAKWYKYIGDGKLISLKLDNKFQYSNQLVVYEGHCDSLKCRNYRDYQTTKFITQKDVVYYFVVQKPEIQSLNDAPFTIEVDVYARRDYRLLTETTPSWPLSLKDYPMTIKEGCKMGSSYGTKYTVLFLFTKR